MFPCNGASTMADHEVKAGEPTGYRKGKGKKERNWMDEEREFLIALYNCLWNVAHDR